MRISSWHSGQVLVAGILIMTALLSLAGCDSGEESASTVTGATTGDYAADNQAWEVEDGTWDLQVNRSGDSQDADEAFEFLPDTYYHPIQDGPTYHVVISHQGTCISIEGTRAGDDFIVEGTRTAASERTVYSLDAFAGGRFVVWQTLEGLQGELTIYGSGLPILFSERGRMIKAP